ncbi:MAG: hypothetical protein ACYCW6_14265 [Candidatus Xenobia bacterium]
MLSLGAANPVALALDNPCGLPWQVELFDETPLGFTLDLSSIALTLPARSNAQARYHVEPAERGNHHFGPLRIRYRTPLGLLVAQRTYALERAVRVYPNVMELNKAQLLASRRHLEMMGLRRWRGASMTTEFDSLREY